MAKKCNSWVDTIMFLGNNFIEANFTRSTKTILLRTLLKMLYLYRQPTSDMDHHVMYSRELHKNNNVNKKFRLDFIIHSIFPAVFKFLS